MWSPAESLQNPTWGGLLHWRGGAGVTEQRGGGDMLPMDTQAPGQSQCPPGGPALMCVPRGTLHPAPKSGLVGSKSMLGASVHMPPQGGDRDTGSRQPLWGMVGPGWPAPLRCPQLGQLLGLRSSGGREVTRQIPPPHTAQMARGRRPKAIAKALSLLWLAQLDPVCLPQWPGAACSFSTRHLRGPHQRQGGSSHGHLCRLLQGEQWLSPPWSMCLDPHPPASRPPHSAVTVHLRAVAGAT